MSTEQQHTGPFAGHDRMPVRKSDVVCMCKVSLATGDILQRFTGPIDQAVLQRCGDGELWQQIEGDLASNLDVGITHRMVFSKSGAKPYLRQRSKTDIDARRARIEAIPSPSIADLMREVVALRSELSAVRAQGEKNP